MQQTLQLRKVRDLGEKISDSFLFLKRNIKNLLQIYFVFVVPFIILAFVIAIFFAGNLYSQIVSEAYDFSYSDLFNYQFFLILLCLLIAYGSYHTTISCYFSLYDQQKGIAPTIQQVGQLFFKKILKVILNTIAVSVILGLVAVIPYLIIMFIPLVNLLGQIFLGILFSTILITLTNIFVREDLGIGGAFSRLFDLFRDKWWHVIGFSCVNYLIYYVFATVLIFAGVMFFTLFVLNMASNPLGEDSPLSMGKISVIGLVIAAIYILSQLFQLIVVCGGAINYYSICEEKDGTAIEEMIDTIGESTDKYGGVEEQY